ncbi:MbtH family NRPS accessory protein [Streptomyces sp. NPDC006529]
MANPFDDSGSGYLGLIDDEGSSSLWPAFAAAPDGWTFSRRWK